MDKKRISFTPTGLHIREAQQREDGTTEPSRVVAGCAIVFEKETVLWQSAGYKECEVIAKDCITEEWLKEQDIKMNLLHMRDSSLARYRKGEGSLKLDLREDGLYFEFEAPKCDLGDRVLALVANGTYTGCSFEFYSKDYTVSQRGEEDYLIRHTQFEKLTALTIAMDPAYEDTTVGLREEWGKQHPEEVDHEKEMEERKKREMTAKIYAHLLKN